MKKTIINRKSRLRNKQRKKTNIFSIYGYGVTINDLTQTFLVMLGIINLIVIFWISLNQAELSRKALLNTEISNNYTLASIKLAEKNFIIENRAWVGIVSEVHRNYTGGIGSDLEASISFRNFGKTPAENVHVGCSFGFLPNHSKVSFNTPFTIPPTESSSASAHVPKYPDSLFRKINDGQIHFYFFGVITYTDIYKGLDTTEFTFLYENKTDTFIPAGFNRMK